MNREQYTEHRKITPQFSMPNTQIKKLITAQTI